MSLKYILNIHPFHLNKGIKLIKKFDNTIVFEDMLSKLVLVKKDNYYTGFKLDNLLEIDKDFSEEIAVIKVNKNKYSYIDIRGIILGNRIYDECLSFKNGYAVYRYDNKYGYIDKYGIELTEPIYDECSSFYNNKAVVKKGDKYFFLNTDLKEEELNYFKIFKSETGIYRYKTKDNNIGYFDSNGNTIIEEKMTDKTFTDISNSMGVINNKLIILSNNKIINTIELGKKSNIEVIDNYILIKFKSKYEINDLKGNIIYTSNNKYINIKDNILKEQNKNKYYFINLTNKEQINKEGFTKVDDFYNKKCFVKDNDKVYLLHVNKKLELTEYDSFERINNVLTLIKDNEYLLISDDRNIEGFRLKRDIVDKATQIDLFGKERIQIDSKVKEFNISRINDLDKKALEKELKKISKKYNIKNLNKIKGTVSKDVPEELAGTVNILTGEYTELKIENVLNSNNYLFDIYDSIDRIIKVIKNKESYYLTLNKDLKELYKKDNLIEIIIKELEYDKRNLNDLFNEMVETEEKIDYEYEDETDYELHVKQLIRETLLMDEYEYDIKTDKNRKVFYLGYKNYLKEYTKELQKRVDKLPPISLETEKLIKDLINADDIDLDDDQEEVYESLQDTLMDLYKLDESINALVVGSYMNLDLDYGDKY